MPLWHLEDARPLLGCVVRACARAEVALLFRGFVAHEACFGGDSADYVGGVESCDQYEGIANEKEGCGTIITFCERWSSNGWLRRFGPCRLVWCIPGGSKVDLWERQHVGELNYKNRSMHTRRLRSLLRRASTLGVILLLLRFRRAGLTAERMRLRPIVVPWLDATDLRLRFSLD
jgi:hypothetical protein